MSVTQTVKYAPPRVYITLISKNEVEFEFPLALVTFSRLLREIYGIPKPNINEDNCETCIKMREETSGGGSKELRDESLNYCKDDDDTSGSGSEDESDSKSDSKSVKFPVPNVSTEMLEFMVKFLDLNKEQYIEQFNPNEKKEGWEPYPIHSVADYEKSIGEYNVIFFKELNNVKTILELANAANFMGVNSLTLACSSWIAAQLTIKTIEEMQDYLGFERNINEEDGMETLSKEELAKRKEYFTLEQIAKVEEEFSWIESLHTS